jgi:hypothetical protein
MAQADTFTHQIALFCTVSGNMPLPKGVHRFFSIKSTAYKQD